MPIFALTATSGQKGFAVTLIVSIAKTDQKTLVKLHKVTAIGYFPLAVFDFYKYTLQLHVGLHV